MPGMRERILDLVRSLRAHGMDVSLAETLDAVRAVAAAGVERPVLREALAATLVKSESDRPAFDRLFDAAFPLVGAARAVGRRRRGAGGGEPAGGTGRGAGGEGGSGRPVAEPPHAATGGVPGEKPAGSPARVARPSAMDAHRRADAGPGAERRRARARALLALPFREFTARDVAEARELVRVLGARLRGRLARRERRGRRGRLDFRRTIRAATMMGGVPLCPRFRRRRPGRPDLVALCDLSGSVAAASELLLGLVAPAAHHFRRTDLYAYVDRLCPVSIEDGHVAPGGRLDLHARSDFGRVLEDLLGADRGRLGRSTLVLVLGDARNNRRPPRADLFRALRERVQRIVWLVPEPRARWDTGDSVLRLYAPACDAVLECLDLGALVRAVRRVV
jgi:hypothetical protein